MRIGTQISAPEGFGQLAKNVFYHCLDNDFKRPNVLLVQFSWEPNSHPKATVHEKPSYRDAWRLARHCIIPAEAIYEPDWRYGKAVPTRITRADGKPMGIAGLWSVWKAPTGDVTHSFTMLTINADEHPFMRQYHKPEDEKRMVVILSERDYDSWLSAPANQSRDFLRQFPADNLVGECPQHSLL